MTREEMIDEAVRDFDEFQDGAFLMWCGWGEGRAERLRVNHWAPVWIRTRFNILAAREATR